MNIILLALPLLARHPGMYHAAVHRYSLGQHFIKEFPPVTQIPKAIDSTLRQCEIDALTKVQGEVFWEAEVCSIHPSIS